MRSPRTTGVAALLAGLSLAGVLSACSSSHDAVAASATRPAQGSEAGPAHTAGAAVPGTGTAQQRISSEGGSVAVPTHKVLARLSAAEVKGYTLGSASATAKSRLAAATKSVAATSTGVTYYSVRKAGADVADVAVYRFKPETATSKVFQAQIVSQLVTTAAKTHKVKFDKVSGSLLTVAGTSPAAVGLFQGQSAVVVLGAKGTQSLDAASGAAYAYLRG